MSGEALLALAARVEAATGADRRLDAEIAGATLPSWSGIDEEGIVFKAKYGSQPRYTGSTDAALTLVDEQHQSMVMWDRDERTASAIVGPNALAGFPMGMGYGKGLTAIDAQARALSAAALKARALQSDPAIRDREGE